MLMLQKILITGAKNGIGRSAAFALAERGHDVLATTKTDKEAHSLQKEAREKGSALRVERLDITDAGDHATAVDFGPDILINNAAIGESGPLAEVPEKALERSFEVNVFGTIELTQKVLKTMIGEKHGRVIIISSVGGKMVIPYLGPYSMSKFALEASADAFRQELSAHNVDVSVIEPGAIATGFNERMNASKYEWFDENQSHHHPGRIQTFEEMLVSNQHSTQSITRAIIHAVEAQKPKSRYVRPFLPYAPMLWLAQALPDRARDWILRKMAGA